MTITAPARPAPREQARLDIEPRVATDLDLRDLTIVLTRAFDDDPFVNWLVKADGRRRHNIARLMGHVLRVTTFPHGDVYTSADYHGAACWVPPGVAGPGFLRVAPHLPGLARAIGWRRLGVVGRALAHVEAKHPREPHYYLATLGVAPEHQGRGAGGQLMRPVLERCDRDGIPAYLESSKERNVPFYERHGFSVTDVHDVAPGGPRLWLMVREPR